MTNPCDSKIWIIIPVVIVIKKKKNPVRLLHRYNGILKVFFKILQKAKTSTAFIILIGYVKKILHLPKSRPCDKDLRSK